jgi:hypothetical protein
MAGDYLTYKLNIIISRIDLRIPKVPTLHSIKGPWGPLAFGRDVGTFTDMKAA